MTSLRSLVLLFVAGAVLAGCEGGSEGAKGGKGKPGAMRFPVEVAPVEARRVEYEVRAVGSVEAFEKVQATARVAGVVERVRFAEGDEVKAGEVLVEIEPERYRLAADAARAALAKAEAAKAEAESALARRERVEKESPGLIPGEQIESFRTRAIGAAADVAQAKAALSQAALNLRDAFVRAPVAGTMETRTVQTGQYIQPGAVLATLVRRDPLLLRFQVPELEAVRLSQGLTARFPVRDGGPDARARITHVALAADANSRLVPVTAEVFPDDRDRLRPGTFAEVRVGVGSAIDAPVIPETAIRPSEKGFLAYVIEDGRAQERVLTLGLRTGDGLVEVRQGVLPGEILVVRGAEALREGSEVRVVEGAGAGTDEPPGSVRATPASSPAASAVQGTSGAPASTGRDVQ